MCIIMKEQLGFDGKIPIRSKSIELLDLKHDECCICCATYKHNDRISKCYQCHQYLHLACLINWCSAALSIPITCPFCRTAWRDTGKLYYPLANMNMSLNSNKN